MDERNVYTHNKYTWTREMCTLMSNMHGCKKLYTHDKYAWIPEMYTLMGNMHGREKCV